MMGVFFNKDAVTFDPAPFRASANDVRNQLLVHLAALGFDRPQIASLTSFTSSLPAAIAGPSDRPGIRGEGNVSITRVAEIDFRLRCPRILRQSPIGVSPPNMLMPGGTGVAASDLHSQTLLAFAKRPILQ